MSKFNVSAPLFAAVRTAASTDPTRDYLRGVRILPHNGGVLMVATDGRKLAIAFDPEGFIEEATTLRVLADDKELKAGADKRLNGDRRIVGEAGTTVSVVNAAEQVAAVALTEKPSQNFPEFERVLPPDAPMARIDGGAAFSAKYIAEIDKAYSLTGTVKDAGVVFSSADPNGGPTWVRSATSGPMRDLLAFVLMPLRTSRCPDEVRPSWLNAVPVTSEIAAE